MLCVPVLNSVWHVVNAQHTTFGRCYAYRENLANSKHRVICSVVAFFMSIVIHIQVGHECFCGSSSVGFEEASSERDCSMTCYGNITEKCGNANRLSIYKIHYGKNIV